ncbi:malate dehydrogenase, partial [Raphidocelis subcapitata]
GVVYAGRDDMTPDNYLYDVAATTDKRTLKEAVEGADVFLGLSAGNLLTPEMLLTMARDPVVFACANPMPEIDPDLAAATRPDVIVATGRSDFPNQINNVCVFPHIFRGALDCRARCVNEEMKLAATHAIAAIARKPASLKRRTPSVGDLASLVGGGLNLGDKAGGGGSGSGNGAGGSDADGSGGGAAATGSVVSCSTAATAPPANGGSGRPPTPPLPVGVRHPSPARTASPALGGRPGSPTHRRRKSQGPKSIDGDAEAAAAAAAAAALALAPAFGRDYIIPRPFDDRLAVEVPAAVVQAAIDTGVARVTDFDMAEYKRSLADLTLRLNL